MASVGDPNFMLSVVQQPVHGRIHNGKDKDRKPIDPPPVVRLQVTPGRDPNSVYLTNPYHFVMCHLIEVGDKDTKGQTIEKPVEGNKLVGTIVSSLHRLKDVQNQDVAYFVFSDVSVKIEGFFKLHFTLYEMGSEDCRQLSAVKSEPFYIYPAKTFPGLAESTFLTRSLSDQGVRVRIRKDSRQSQSIKQNKRYAAPGDDLRKEPPQRQRTDEDGNYQVLSLGDTSLSPTQPPGIGHNPLHVHIPSGPTPRSAGSMIHSAGGMRSQRQLSAGLSSGLSNASSTLSPQRQMNPGFSGYYHQPLSQGHLMNGSGLSHGQPQLVHSPTTISPTSTHSMPMYGTHVGSTADYHSGYGHIGAHPAHPHYHQPPPSA